MPLTSDQSLVVRQQIAACLGIDISQAVSNANFFRDLGGTVDHLRPLRVAIENALGVSIEPIVTDINSMTEVVAEYLQALADGRPVPRAAVGDPRWARLAGADPGLEGDDEEDDLEGEEEDEDEISAPPPRRRPKRESRASWDDKIRQLIDAQSREELVELVWSLTQRFPELREEFRERIALSEGDVDHLMAEARRELHNVASEPGWQNSCKAESEQNQTPIVFSKVGRHK